MGTSFLVFYSLWKVPSDGLLGDTKLLVACLRSQSLSHLFLSWRELRRSDVLRSWANLFGRTLKKLIFKTLGFGELIKIIRSPKGLMLMLGKLDAVNAMGNGSFYEANGKLAIDVGKSGRWVLLCNNPFSEW
jgi:hypothetical protein